MQRIIFHVDMDAFYTSVEERDQPELRGRPVVVGADPKGGAGRGVVAAASYEARKFGIHSAMPISRAYRLCPDAAFVRGNMSKYSAVSQNLRRIFGTFTDLVEPLSIDEAFLDVTGSVHLYGSSLTLARAVKERIRAEEALAASIGIAPNKFLAKVASDLSKPDGLLEVKSGEEQAFLKDLPVERLWGVGPKTAEELHKLGLYTIGAVARLSEGELAARFGKHGEHLQALACGRDDRPVSGDGEPKSTSQETTFDEDTADPETLRRTLLELAEGVARRLRKYDVVGRTVTLKYRDEHFQTLTRARSLHSPTADARALFETVLSLFERVHGARKVRLLGVSLSNLEPKEAPRQLGLFEAAATARKEDLDRKVDALAEKFGESAVRKASLTPPPIRK